MRVDIANGTSLDINSNNIPDECDRPGDTNGDGHNDVNDLLTVISSWGPCATPPTACPGDVFPWSAGDGHVSTADLLLVLMNWVESRAVRDHHDGSAHARAEHRHR